MQNTKRRIQNVLSERRASFPQTLRQEMTPLLFPHLHHLGAFSCPDLSYCRGSSACADRGEDIQCFYVGWGYISDLQSSLNFIGVKRDKLALSEQVKDLVLDLQPISKWNAVCWVELRCVDKAFSTDMLSGWLTDECVCMLGAGKQEVTNVLPGRPLLWGRTGQHGHVNVTEV